MGFALKICKLLQNIPIFWEMEKVVTVTEKLTFISKNFVLSFIFQSSSIITDLTRCINFCHLKFLNQVLPFQRAANVLGLRWTDLVFTVLYLFIFLDSKRVMRSSYFIKSF